jgi:LmbE family N-acetylglucosaminyl deacetylase
MTIYSDGPVLVVAPHADDETLGAGGSIARFVAAGRAVTVALMTGHGPDPHPLFSLEVFEQVRGEFHAAMSLLGVTETISLDLPSTLLDTLPQHQINRAALEVLERVQPELVLLPFEHDLHQDHASISYAFRVALRPHLPGNRRPHMVLSYETPTETHLQSHLRPACEPDVWIDISDHLQTKLSALSAYSSQIAPAPALRSLNAVDALARWRGAQIGVAAAEAFVLHRAVA